MKTQLEKLAKLLKGFSLVGCRPAGTAGVIDLTLEMQTPAADKDALTVVKNAMRSAGLEYAALGLFSAVPKNAVVARGVYVSPVSEPSASNPEPRKN